MNAPAATLPPFQAPFAPPDEALAAVLLADAARDRAAEGRIDARAQKLVEAIRAKAGGLGGVEEFLHAYSLSTKEGLALMVLAEALLRVPDAATADRLIEDKLAAGRWRDGDVKSTALLVSASAWTLGIAARVIHPGETPETILDSIVRRLGLPTVRAATRQAMRLLGSHFVLGQTIDEALHRARGHAEFRYSFDMLGEGARTAADADKYFDAYAGAIAAIGAQAGNAELPQRPGISVKLSALHPRYEAISRERVLKELVPRLTALAQLARDGDLQFTVDAEEADRLELSLEIIAAVLGDASLARLGRLWPRGAGLSEARVGRHRLDRGGCRRVTAPADGSTGQGRVLGHRDQARPGARACRLSGVHAQGDDRSLLHGLRETAARGARPPLSAIRHPQRADGRQRDRGRRRRRGFRIPAALRHGRGALRGACSPNCPTPPAASMRRSAATAICSPIWCGGSWRTAPTRRSCRSPPIRACRSREILRRPQSWIAGPQAARNSKIPLPRDIYLPERRGAAGVEFGDRASLDALLRRGSRRRSSVG